MTKDEYFCYEWLLLEKHVTSEKYKLLTQLEYNALQVEYRTFKTT